MNHTNGNIKNIPPKIMLDQFGMLGFLMMLKQGQSPSSEHERNTPMLYSMDESYMSEYRLFEPCPNMPSEYRCDGAKKLADLSSVLQNSNVDLLFYMFYNYCRMDLQAKSHEALTSRGWCYDAKFKVWLKCAEANTLGEKAAGGQLYDLFEPSSWSIRRVNLNDLAKPSH